MCIVSLGSHAGAFANSKSKSQDKISIFLNNQCDAFPPSIQSYWLVLIPIDFGVGALSKGLPFNNSICIYHIAFKKIVI